MCSKQEPPQDWTSKPFEDFLGYINNVMQVLHLTVRGISMIPGGPETVRVLEKYYQARNLPNDTQRDLEIAEMNAKLAQREIDSGFALIHAQVTVSLWGALEDLVRTFAAQWILHRPEILQQEPFANFKISWGTMRRPTANNARITWLNFLNNQSGRH